MSIDNDPQKLTFLELQTVDETDLSAGLPKSIVIGNESIKFLKHSLHNRIRNSRTQTPRIEIAIRNISNTMISNIVFEATFYDIEENIVDIVNHNEIELKPQTSRAFGIACSKDGVYQVKYYKIRISKMTMSSEEKVQLRQHKIRTTETAEEEVSGIVKNISNEKTDAVLVANFFDRDDEKIGAKCVILRDIEPDKYKRFHFIFRPAKDKIVMTYNLNIISDIEEF